MQVDFEELSLVREDHPKDHVVFRGGCFDLFHEGHVEALRFAKELGDILFVGVSSDERIRQRKGRNRPIVPELSRLAVVDAVKYVDFSFIMPLPQTGLASPTMQVVEKLQPDVFVDNGENSASWTIDELEAMEAQGTRVVIDPHRDYRISTTKIIETITEGAN